MMDNVHYHDCGNGFVVHTYVKIYVIVHFKYIYFIICQFYLNKVV